MDVIGTPKVPEIRIWIFSAIISQQSDDNPLLSPIGLTLFLLTFSQPFTEQKIH